MAATSQTAEQRELTLIGKVEMRIALADSDSKLESLLSTYLAPLLLKLASEHVSVRNKVISVCQHISTRIKPQSIQLPVAALVKQFKDQEGSLVRHFDLVYIKQGVERLPEGKKAELLPAVVSGIAKTGNHGSEIFNLLLRLLAAFTLPPRGSKEDLDLRHRFEVTDDDATYLASWIGRFILFAPQKAGATACPGLSTEEYEFIGLNGREGLWDPSSGGLNITRTKALAARLLASGLFTDQERFLPALFASADAASTISDVGEDMLKRALPAMNLEDEGLLKTLFRLYFGENGVARVRAPLRLKILGLLNKSTRSTTFSHNLMRMVDDGVATSNVDGDDVLMSGTVTSGNSGGREATKLRSAIFQYVNFAARYGAPDDLHAVAPRVILRLRDYIDNQGWPRVGPSEDLTSRGYAYEVIGLLAIAGPRSILVEEEHSNFDLLRWLLESLASDTSGSSIIVSIEESLSTVLRALSRQTLSSDEQNVLEELLIDQMSNSVDPAANQRLRSTRYVSLRFANRCLPYVSVKARWIDILGLASTNDRAEVREEAERGLSPYWYQMINGSLGEMDSSSFKFPSFEAITQQFFGGRTTEQPLQPMAVAVQARERYPTAYPHMTAFARRLLMYEAMAVNGSPVNLDNDWERRIDASAESNDAARGAIRAHVHGLSGTASDAIELLASALFIQISDQTTAAAHNDHLVELLALSPDTLVQKLAPRAVDLKAALQSNSHASRMTAAHVFGILASTSTAAQSAVSSTISELLHTANAWQSAVGAEVNRIHGAVSALGFYYSRVALRFKNVGAETDGKYLKLLVSLLLNSKEAALKEASYVAFGQLCLFGSISLSQLLELTTANNIADVLYESAKGGNEPAILCLGQFSMILGNHEEAESDLAYVEEQLHKLHEIRQAETHFAVGEAFTYLASGWHSTALATKMDINVAKPEIETRSSLLKRVADRILADCTNTKPALKKAAVMWLLCIVQFCGHLPEVQERLAKCQTAFKRCLGDRDELVQESASRGLGLIYEKGDRKLKDDLVRDLVSSFSSDRQSQLAGNVTAETQLFEPGALPTGDGSVSTYKDIMSLASEVGDSSLVYKFMSMASSNAIWSSRAAFGRFGLSNVLSDSSVDGYLASNPKLYPKLYRYRFDPNSGVQRSMNDIWKALVKDSAATIDKYFDDIMEDLLNSILGKEWRVRQASCAAIGDLVQGRPLERYEKYLERIWTQCFKVLDDIKESVRAAAATLARVLTGVLTRTLESDHSSTRNAASMLKHVLPFLLSTSGMESSAQEVQSFSVHTLLEIIKKANGATLRPFIPQLVERLIGSLSSLEPEAVNYLHLNASKYNLTEQKIDDMRLSSVRSSPLMEAIERCLDLLDDDTMKALQPNLEAAMKSAVGLPSKVGSSRVLVSLSTRRIAVFRPYADSFLRLIEKLIADRNETVSSSYAVAAGYVARPATDKHLLRLIDFAKRLYFESDGDRESSLPRRSLSAGEITYAIAKHAADRFNAVAASILPFVFVAKHDPHEQVKEQFQNTWDESVGGSRAVALYLNEILALSEQHLESPQWVLKHTSARAIADAVTTMAAVESPMADTTAETLWPYLEKALNGKTWEGKHVVLAAFGKFAEAARSLVQRPNMAATVMKIAVREAKRRNATYRPHAIRCLGQVAAVLTDVDNTETVYDVVQPLMAEAAESDPMDIDGADANDAPTDLTQSTLAAGVECILVSVNVRALSGEAVTSRTAKALSAVAAAPKSPAVYRSTYTGVKQLFDRLCAEAKDAYSPDVEASTKALLFGNDPGSEALRLLRADAIVSASTASARLLTAMQASISASIAEERSVQIRDRLTSALSTPHS